MSKKSLKKIIINNRNYPKINENKKTFLDSYQIGNNNYITDEKNKKNYIFNFRTQNELNYSLENKENYFIQNSKTKENYLMQELNYYLNKTNKKKQSDNKFMIKQCKSLNNLQYIKNKKDNIKIMNSKITQNNVINQNINNIQKYNNFNKKALLDKRNIYFKGNEKNCSFRLEENNINCKLTRKNNKNYNKYINPKTERDNNDLGINLNKNYFLPETKTIKKTLILDLDETLVHSSLKPFSIKGEIAIKINSNLINNNSNSNNNQNSSYMVYMLKRPYVDIFLSIVCDIFEVIIFTASTSDYANFIIDILDIEKKIKSRLFREHCIKIDKDRYIKNLYCLGRDLKTLIIIDNNPISYAVNMENGLPISSWESNPADNELIKLIPLLQFLSKKNISDVRPIIQKIVKSNEINYDIVNKLINFSKSKKSIEKKKENKKGMKIINKKDKKLINSLNQKLELNKINNKYNYLISNKEKNIKDIYINDHHEFFIKKLKSQKKQNNRGNSENQKNINTIDFDESKENINLIKKRNYNLFKKYFIFKTDNNKFNYKAITTDINRNICKNKIKLKPNKSFKENYIKDINISLPNSYSLAILLDKNNRNKINSQKKSGTYFNKTNLNKNLIKNYSDYGCNIPKLINIKKCGKDLKLKYPSLKNLFYRKIFQKYYIDSKYNNKAKTKISLNSKYNLINKNKSMIRHDI